VGFRRTASQPHEYPASVRVPVRCTQPRERRDEVNAVGVIDAGGERFDFRGRLDDPQTVSQPLHNRSGNEDATFIRVFAFAAVPTRDRGQQPRRRRGGFFADVHQHEATGSVSVLGHTRLRAILAEQSRLLVASGSAQRN